MITIAIRLQQDYETSYSTIPRTTHSTTTEVIEITIRLRYDYDVSRAPASIRREQKINMSIFRRSRVVVVS